MPTRPKGTKFPSLPHLAYPLIGASLDSSSCPQRGLSRTSSFPAVRLIGPKVRLNLPSQGIRQKTPVSPLLVRGCGSRDRFQDPRRGRGGYRNLPKSLRSSCDRSNTTMRHLCKVMNTERDQSHSVECAKTVCVSQGAISRRDVDRGVQIACQAERD